MTSPNPAVGFTMGILSGFCGREPGSDSMWACSHNHSGEAEALVRMVEQHRFPELLRELLHDTSSDMDVAERARNKLAELESRADRIESR
jgi:hypothetical protein